MYSKVDLRDLTHFMERVQRYNELTRKKSFKGAMEELCKEAVKYAEGQYGEHGHSDIKVRYDNPDGTLATIIAEGNEVAFFEFGTGDVGKGTYPDETKLPTTGVPLTEGWVYYYEEPPSSAKRTSHGVRGWFFNKKFQTGNRAEAEMWKTSQFIQQNAGRIIKDYFRSESGG